MNIDTNGIELGDRARDPMTGVEGVVTGFAQFTTGCARVALQMGIRKDGTVPEQHWVDVLTAEVTKANPAREVDRKVGGPQPAPARRADARR